MRTGTFPFRPLKGAFSGGEVKVRIVPYSEIASCPDLRLDAKHYIPKHKVEEHRKKK